MVADAGGSATPPRSHSAIVVSFQRTRPAAPRTPPPARHAGQGARRGLDRARPSPL